MKNNASTNRMPKRKGGKHWPEWTLTGMIEIMERQGLVNFVAALKDVRLEMSKYRRACHLSLRR
jgi:hypothetical protein